MMFPPTHRPVSLMPADSPTLPQIGMHAAQQIAHAHSLSAVMVVMQCPDGTVRMAGYTIGMGDHLRGARQLATLIQHAKVDLGEFIINHEEPKGNC